MRLTRRVRFFDTFLVLPLLLADPEQDLGNDHRRWRRCVVGGGFARGGWTSHAKELASHWCQNQNDTFWMWTPVDQDCALDTEVTPEKLCQIARDKGVLNWMFVGDSVTVGFARMLQNFFMGGPFQNMVPFACRGIVVKYRQLNYPSPHPEIRNTHDTSPVMGECENHRLALAEVQRADLVIMNWGAHYNLNHFARETHTELLKHYAHDLRNWLTNMSSSNTARNSTSSTRPLSRKNMPGAPPQLFLFRTMPFPYETCEKQSHGQLLTEEAAHAEEIKNAALVKTGSPSLFSWELHKEFNRVTRETIRKFSSVPILPLPVWDISRLRPDLHLDGPPRPYARDSITRLLVNKNDCVHYKRRMRCHPDSLVGQNQPVEMYYWWTVLLHHFIETYPHILPPATRSEE